MSRRFCFAITILCLTLSLAVPAQAQFCPSISVGNCTAPTFGFSTKKIEIDIPAVGDWKFNLPTGITVSGFPTYTTCLLNNLKKISSGLLSCVEQLAQETATLTESVGEFFVTAGEDATNVVLQFGNNLEIVQKLEQQVAMIEAGMGMIGHFMDTERYRLEVFLSGMDPPPTNPPPSLGVTCESSGTCKLFLGDLLHLINQIEQAATLSNRLLVNEFTGGAGTILAPGVDLQRIEDFLHVSEVPAILVFPFHEAFAAIGSWDELRDGPLDPSICKGSHDTACIAIESFSKVLEQAIASLESALAHFESPQRLERLGAGTGIQAFGQGLFTQSCTDMYVDPDNVQSIKGISTALNLFGLIAQVVGGIMESRGMVTIKGADVGASVAIEGTITTDQKWGRMVGKFISTVGTGVRGWASSVDESLRSCAVVLNQRMSICLTGLALNPDFSCVEENLGWVDPEFPAIDDPLRLDCARYCRSQVLNTGRWGFTY